ncbi:MAG: prepilin-type N-terminal cleavage/methylation domain-containing protein [Lachnospiraceae bacterium]|nr:prepilin-type N-terminal cleavage/methylation domain-containing protein [Lachnospiraceae bacterium]
MKKKNNRGFSLIELIIVVAIMAIMLGVLAPQYLKYVEKSRIAVDDDTANELLTAACIMLADEDYAPYINAGDRIEYASTGVVLNPNNNYISAGLDEYSIGWQNKKVKSRLYNTKVYIIEFQYNAGEMFAIGDWQS